MKGEADHVKKKIMLSVKEKRILLLLHVCEAFELKLTEVDQKAAKASALERWQGQDA